MCRDICRYCDKDAGYMLNGLCHDCWNKPYILEKRISELGGIGYVISTLKKAEESAEERAVIE